MDNVIDARHIASKIKEIRYIIDESYGSSNNEFNTSWVEIQAYNSVHTNVAFDKKVIANFRPMMDVTGQSDLSVITNGQISQREWVSCNITLIKKLPAKIIIDLEQPISDITMLYLYHGWWTERSYKNKVYVAENIMEPICIYDYQKDGPVYESIGKPLIIKLR